jgi:glycosyltransferase involved in cell wall biosynthesis
VVSSPPTPVVSVVIPTRNRWRRLQRALRMALEQEGIDLEVVVVDDGSTDDSPPAIGAVQDPRVRMLRNETSRAVAAARNRGIQAATAEWIAFLDDDDLWSPHKLRLQLERVAATGADLAYAGAVRLREPDIVLGVDAAPSPLDFARQMLVTNVLPSGPSNVLARADLVRRLGGFDEALDFAADWDLWIRLGLRGSAAACPELLVGYVEHEGNMSVSVGDAAIAEFRYLVAKHRSASAEAGVRFDVARFMRGVAYGHLRAGRRLQAARAYVRGAVSGNVGNVARAAAAAVGGPPARRLSHDEGVSPPDVEWLKRAWPIWGGEPPAGADR